MKAKGVRNHPVVVRRIVGLLLAVGLLGSGIVYALGRHLPPVDTVNSSVVVTRTGFVPRRRIVTVNTSVSFTSIAAAPFWPASDPHPQHSLYAPFDPQRALAPDEGWSYTFTRAGTYRYHDHLNPQAVGEIIVIPAQGERTGALIRIAADELAGRIRRWLRPVRIDWNARYAACDAEADYNSREICWKNTLAEMIDTRGIDYTLSTLAGLIPANQMVATACHVLVDFVGEYSYERYREGDRFRKWELTPICNHGFYHGFMSEYVSHSRNYPKAQAFCDDAAARVPGDPTQLMGQCIRGIGNGLSYLHASVYWKNVEEILRHALADCRKFSLYSECVDGVFSGIDHMYFVRHGYSLDMNADDPYWFCRAFDPDLKRRCYERMTPPIYHATGNNLAATGQAVARLDDRAAARQAMVTLGELHMRLNGAVFSEPEREKAVAVCRTFPPDLAEACIHGMVQAIIFSGERTEANERGREFCRAAFLSADERASCLDFVAGKETTPY